MLNRSMSFKGAAQAVCSAVLLAAFLGNAVAKPDDITDVEMQLLPRYCRDTMGFGYGDAVTNTSPRAGYWVSLMGRSFWAMHHYCWGLISMGRALRAGLPEANRRALWESAKGDFNYVVKNSTPDFIMLPEIYTRIGDADLALGRPGAARQAFEKARGLKADYWPAYSRWAEYLIGAGQRGEAIKIVIAGLENAPDSKVLRQQFQLLGGKAADFPKPRPKSKQIEADAPENEKQEVGDPVPNPNVTETPAPSERQPD